MYTACVTLLPLALLSVHTSTAIVRSQARLHAAAKMQAKEDWHEVRARLVAKEKIERALTNEQLERAVMGTTANESAKQGEPIAAPDFFETPLIEVGSLLLDAVPGQHSTGQPFFQKSVMVVIEHEAHEFTLGLLLNRPSACTIDGWRLHYGGPVGEGGLFHRHETDEVLESPATPRALLCLHLLDAPHPASSCSFPVVPGVWFTTFEQAVRLVEAGEARKADFVTMCGYCGWGADQLQGEYDRGDWVIASSPSVLLRELISERLDAPHEDPSAPSDGIQTWSHLMSRVGRTETVERANRLSRGDGALKKWIRTHLGPPTVDEHGAET